MRMNRHIGRSDRKTRRMRVLFRADASVEIGTGHVVRCATLADALRAQGATVAFACRALPGNLLEWLAGRGFTTLPLSRESPDQLTERDRISAATVEFLQAAQAWANGEPLDWLVVDHYGLDAHWERAIRSQVGQFLVVDDLYNRPHDCDLLLDQNLLDANSKQYQELVPAHCQLLLGPTYALLRPEFHQARAAKTNRSDKQPNNAPKAASEPTLHRVLVFFGGSDPTRECFKALDALQLLPPDLPVQVDLVAGASNPAFEALQARCTDFPRITLHRQVNAMADLMSRADLSIGAGGTTTWERFCLGLPGIVVAVADNQVEISQALAEQGYHIYLGESPQVSAAMLSRAILDLIRQPERRQALAAKTMALVDGLGVQRVVNQMVEMTRNASSA
jgi:UDP-2,4-diacetamido-2,4,6-trideoxy-beta-L-altropyranose hydrolase